MFESVDLYKLLRFLTPGFLPLLLLNASVALGINSESIVVLGILSSVMLGAIVSTLVQGDHGHWGNFVRWLTDFGASATVRRATTKRLPKPEAKPPAGNASHTDGGEQEATWGAYEGFRVWIPTLGGRMTRVARLRELGQMYTSRSYYFMGSALGFVLVGLVAFAHGAHLRYVQHTATTPSGPFIVGLHARLAHVRRTRPPGHLVGDQVDRRTASRRV